MFKNISNTTLIIAFLALLAIIGILQLTDSGDDTFRSELTVFDSSGVTKILLYPRATDHEVVTLLRTGADWEAQDATMKARGDAGSINTIISQLLNLKPLRMAASSPERWDDFEVSDSLGTRVQLFENEELKVDMVVGKFNFLQQARKAISYVRLYDEDEVYVVDGFLSFSFNQKLSYWRDKTILEGNTQDWTRLTLQFPDGSGYTLARENETWAIGGQPTDSAKTQQYLDKLARLKDSNFADDFTPAGSPAYQLKIEGNNQPAPMVVSAYATADTSRPYIIASSLNPDVYFDGAPGDLFGKIFTPQSALFAEETTGETASAE